jgi:hypothetical protein
MLDDVRQENAFSVDPGRLEGAVEHQAGRSDERVALAVLLVAGLLTHEHQPRRDRTLTEHRLGRSFP